MAHYPTQAEIWKKIQKGTFIIAEIGKNFIQTQEDRPISEYLANAKKLVDEAAKAGADAVKFQTHSVEDEQANIKVVAPHFKGADRLAWVTRNTNATPVKEFWKPLKAHCVKRGVVFFSTPMSRGAAKKLEEVGVDLWKIGSGDILDFVMLDYIRASKKPTIFSSGMSNLAETKKALEFLTTKNKKVALLHCVSRYPCPPEDLNLKTIDFYKERFKMPIGFSDHSVGIESALVAVAMGATVIEKHFSLDRGLWGSDHKVSMTPAELKDMVLRIREIEKDTKKRAEVLASDFAKRSGGKKGKSLQDGEAIFRPLFRKSLVLGRDVKEGETITKDHLYAMRPQAYIPGSPSEQYEKMIGKKAKKAFKKYDPITTKDVK